MKTLCQSTVLKEWYIPKTEEILYQKVSLTPRPPSKNILKDTWQVQREDSHQRGTVTGRLVADEGKMGPKIDFRVQGFPHAAVVQEDERTRGIRRLVHQVKNHPNKGALIAELKTTCTYNPFREQSKKKNHNLVCVEYFELCEISSKTQCPHCSKYWAEGIGCCTCGTFLITTEY